MTFPGSSIIIRNPCLALRNPFWEQPVLELKHCSCESSDSFLCYSSCFFGFLVLLLPLTGSAEICSGCCKNNQPNRKHAGEFVGVFPTFSEIHLSCPLFPILCSIYFLPVPLLDLPHIIFLVLASFKSAISDGKMCHRSPSSPNVDGHSQSRPCPPSSNSRH